MGILKNIRTNLDVSRQEKSATPAVIRSIRALASDIEVGELPRDAFVSAIKPLQLEEVEQFTAGLGTWTMVFLDDPENSDRAVTSQVLAKMSLAAVEDGDAYGGRMLLGISSSLQSGDTVRAAIEALANMDGKDAFRRATMTLGKGFIDVLAETAPPDLIAGELRAFADNIEQQYG